MKNYSIWKDNVELSNYKQLDKDMDVDVLIIGGGLTGVSTFYYLKDSSLKVLLVEQNKLGLGVTGNSTGKLTYMQDSLYDKIIKNFDEDKASLYLKSQKEAIDLVKDIVKKENIECDLENAPSYIYGNNAKEVKKLEKLKNFLEKHNISVIESQNEVVDCKYMIGVEDTYIFHPLKFLYALASIVNNDNIYERTSIKKVEREEDYYVCFTDKCQIKAKYVVLALHYPYFNLPLLFPIKGSLEKSYISASKYKDNNISLIRYSNPMLSMRGYHDYLLYLTNSHNVGSKVNDKKHYYELDKRLKKLNLHPEYRWSNIDIMTNDGLPYIGEIKDNLLIGTGYNTWGMTNSVLAGKILSDIILKKDNTYIELFYPKRVNIGMIIGGMMDGYYNASGYINGYFNSNKNIEYEEVDGKEIAIYEDENGIHKVYTKCPHMGCYLIFNEVEKTWDCPCHASRYDIDGKCISGPSNEDISYNDKKKN